MHARFWLSLLLSWVIAIVASNVRADSATVTVLGVRSLDSEDQLERRISHALRNSARSIEGYRVSDREVSLAQMSLAHGCEDVDVPCLKDIAGTLSADRLIYGTVVRSGDKVRVTLFNFDARSGQVDASAERTVTAAQLADPALSETVLELTQRVAGKRGNAVGTVRITGNHPGAEVSLDGKPAGQLDQNGELVLTQVREGPHALRVASSDGRDRRELSVDVRPDSTTTVRALLTPTLPQVSAPSPEPVPTQPPAENNRRVRRIFGWTSVAVAVGFTAATIYSWVRIEHIQQSDDLKRYAKLYPKNGPGSTNDVCAEAVDETQASRPGTPAEMAARAALEAPATKLCKEADKLEKLQYVFLGGAVAFAGMGTWLLWTGYHGEQRTLALQPNVGLRQAALRATLRF